MEVVHLELLGSIELSNLLSIAALVPRPKVMCKSHGGSYRDRMLVAGAYFALNKWVREVNEEMGSVLIKLDRFFHHEREYRRGQRRQRTDEDLGFNKIREGRFAKDGVHFRGKGLERVEEEMFKVISQ